MYTMKRSYDANKSEWTFWVEDSEGKKVGRKTKNPEEAKELRDYLNNGTEK